MGIDRRGWLVAAGLAALVLVLAWARHRAFWTGFDLAIFDQGAWQLSHGRTNVSLVERHVLADHFPPVMLVFGAYRVAATPAWMLGAQAMAVGLRRCSPCAGAARQKLGAAPERLATLLAPPAGSAPSVGGGDVRLPPRGARCPVPWRRACSTALLRRPGGWRCGRWPWRALPPPTGDRGPGHRARAGRRSRPPSLVLAGSAAVAIGSIVPGWFGETNGWRPHFGHLGTSPPRSALLHPWRGGRRAPLSTSLQAIAVWILAAGIGVAARPLGPRRAGGLAARAPLLSRWEGTELPWYHYGSPVVPFAIGGTPSLASIHQWDSVRLGQRLRQATVIGPILALLIARARS